MLAEVPSQLQVRYADGYLEVESGVVTRHMSISAQAMINDLLACVDERSIDFISIAAGAYAIDRIYRRKASIRNEAGLRTIPVCFHVADFDYWSQPHVADQIAELLNFLSGDFWLVSFSAQKRSTPPGHQEVLDFGSDWRPSRVALYSGGLDSAAGLACAIQAGQRDIVLLTAGHQSAIRRRAKDQVKALQRALPNAGSISHASFVMRLEGSGRIRDQEATQRSRGFLFCVSGAVLAAVCGVDVVDVYENGHGAINLPLVGGGLSSGFSTRGAHPAFLSMMTRLASDVLERSIRFELPFAQMTKADMVARLAHPPGLVSWAQQSRSCIHTSWREPGISHCGYCAACIERHQALEGGGAVDITPYSRPLWEQSTALDDDYFRSYLWQAQRWMRGDLGIKERLDDHCALPHLTASSEDLILLHQHHAAEVLRVYARHADAPLPSNPTPDLLKAA
ncbi:7-cyano-7-deazaguanine synthase [Luteimonas fraxinea]|uniref:7-cyano-7-deazaguanine synthase n=1 Tax=Luteimonas fraxinea TaxID=2901869 RepID=A0ABS8UFN6_9GAMM|nr:7-cyano-7-deazaguanine synthase [Luteimonas fraxinea]MCD9098064.1 7-cyano-7-deazaguanine synthase [Luteimonas fraxinea]UHH09211.1 7-cyano-7-deazaguanine synthase [Luteimonas fraxinea]